MLLMLRWQMFKWLVLGPGFVSMPLMIRRRAKFGRFPKVFH